MTRLIGRLELELLREGFGPGERRLRAGALVTRDAAREERRVGAEPDREPLDGFRGRACLPALDLRDVLLRKPVAGEVGLGQPRGNAELPEPVTEARAARSVTVS